MKADVNQNKTYGDSLGEVAMQEIESSIKSYYWSDINRHET